MQIGSCSVQVSYTPKEITDYMEKTQIELLEAQHIKNLGVQIKLDFFEEMLTWSMRVAFCLQSASSCFADSRWFLVTLTCC